MAPRLNEKIVPWWQEAKAHLFNHRILAPVVHMSETAGVPTADDYVATLVRVVCSQQVSNAAADKITASVLSAAGNRTSNALAQQLLAMSIDELRSAGLSNAKAQALHALMKAVVDGDLSQERLKPLSDEEIEQKLTRIKGIGPWSVTMVLIFALGRPDVWAGGDYGVKKAMAALNASEKDFEDCAPYRTAATWYLWRSLAL